MSGGKSNDFWSLLGQFFQLYPKQRNISDNTVLNWRYTWNIFLSWLFSVKGVDPEKLSIDTVTSQILMEFLDDMVRERKWSPQTRNERLSMIRSFYQYAASVEPLHYKKVKELSRIKKAKCVDSSGVIDYIPKEAMSVLLSIPDPATRLGCRDMFYMSLAYDIAARTAEMTSMKVKDFDPDKKVVTLTGKGRKQRLVPVSCQTIDMYNSYIRSFHHLYDPEAYLFYTIHNGEHTKMSSDTVARFLRIYSDEARKKCPEMPEKVHPHQAFRTSRAMHLLQSDAPLATVALILGHADPITTVKHYAAADTEMKRKLMERASKEMLPDFSDKEAIWKNDKDIIGRLYLGKK